MEDAMLACQKFDDSLFYNNIGVAANRSHMSAYEKGISSELCAENELKTKGYEILGKRVRTQYGEVDILAKKGNDVVAVEVKQRKSLSAARACISIKQQKRIFNALLFIMSNRDELFANYRVDVICFDSVGRFEHIENAFTAESFAAY
ncbi:MAG: YraN family protein [Holosporales bacterium]|nr:YraN family protein [Holosporales bacterium]